MDYLEEARRRFSGDLYAASRTGVVIEAAEPGYARCSLKIEEYHRNAMGNVMGGVYFTMADYAFAIAANLGQEPTVTQASQIVYLAAARGGVLYAETERIRVGKSTCFYKILITDDTGAELAYVTTTGFVLR
jgi:acyl-CoA thioesterase